jgi:hypothetical protein
MAKTFGQTADLPLRSGIHSAALKNRYYKPYARGYSEHIIDSSNRASPATVPALEVGGLSKRSSAGPTLGLGDVLQR